MRARFFPIIFLIFALSAIPAEGRIVYQNFEANNGTTKKNPTSPKGKPEYGWSFAGAAAHLSQEDDPVQEGRRSWVLTIPEGDPVTKGTGIAAQIQTYNVNFVPDCHDRITFWIWSDPSKIGDHTVMVKLFDNSLYKAEGVGIWTTEKAKYHKWTKMEILFNRLPDDFDFEHVDKIELFNYWDGTYYYDDIVIGSANTESKDRQCMQELALLACNPLVEGQCTPVSSSKGSFVIDYLQLRQSNLIER